MDQYMQIFLIIFGSLGGVGIFAGGIGYLRSQYRKGGSQEKSEVLTSSTEIVNFWKSQAENYQTILATKENDWNTKFQALTKEVGELTGRLNTEKAQNDRLEKIFQNRGPEMKEFMEFMVQAVRDQTASHKLIVDALAANSKVLANIHGMAKAENDREVHIEAQITKS